MISYALQIIILGVLCFLLLIVLTVLVAVVRMKAKKPKEDRAAPRRAVQPAKIPSR